MNTFTIDIPSLYEYTSPQKSLLLFELSTLNFPKEFPCIP